MTEHKTRPTREALLKAAEICKKAAAFTGNPFPTYSTEMLYSAARTLQEMAETKS